MCAIKIYIYFLYAIDWHIWIFLCMTCGANDIQGMIIIFDGTQGIVPDRRHIQPFESKIQKSIYDYSNS
jgi:hypothetical protein